MSKHLLNAFGLAAVVCLSTNCVGQDSALRQGPTEKFASSDSRWHYMRGSDEPGFTRPVSRNLTMSAKPFDDLDVEVEWQGASQWYTQVRYGNEASVRVTLIVDELLDGEFHLYADRDRDRVIQSAELIEGTGREREFLLNAVVAQEEYIYEYPRVVRCRRSITGRQISMGTLGFVSGTAMRGEVRTPVRLVDGDVNGLFADDRDRIWIDVNSDGRWNPFGEQFPFRPMLILNEQRWAVRADRVGRQFRLSEVTGVGELRLMLPALSKTARIQDFGAMVSAEDGSVYSLSKLGESLKVPVGRYTPQSLRLVIDTGEKQPWYYMFSRSSTPKASDWFEVKADGKTDIDAIGQLNIFSGIETEKSTSPGASVMVKPRLYTGHGLLINMSCRGLSSDKNGSEKNHNPALICLVSQDGNAVANARSGFA